MKTQLIPQLALAASLLATTTQAQQSPDVLKTRAALIDAHAKQLAEHDAKWEAVLGADWKTKLADPASEAKVLVDAYIAKPYPFTLAIRLPDPEAKRLVAHILAKPILVKEDLKTLKEAAVGHPSVMQTAENTKLVASRMDELMALQPEKASDPLDMLHEKYAMLHGDRNWCERVTISEWLLTSTGNFDAEHYKRMKERILGIATETLLEKKIKAGEAADGPDFDAALVPVVEALNAPLFAGLAEALLPLGVEVTMPDYTAVVERTPRLVAAIERRSVPEGEAKKSLGTVMFAKGVTAYNAWKTARAKW